MYIYIYVNIYLHFYIQIYACVCVSVCVNIKAAAAYVVAAYTEAVPFIAWTEQVQMSGLLAAAWLRAD